MDTIDGSLELCKLASVYTGIKVQNMLFQDLDVVEKYDGIWACSSVLHLSLDELLDVMCKMSSALKHNGIIYTSFKYGTFSGERNGRFFTDMTEKTFADFIHKIDGLETEEQWITSDVHQGRAMAQFNLTKEIEIDESQDNAELRIGPTDVMTGDSPTKGGGR